MTDIYDLHSKAFENVSAYVILKDGERVATVAFRYPRDGAGRLWAYVHWFGTEMARGYASGGGYDKHSAACAAAVRAIKPISGWENLNAKAPDYMAFRAAMALDNGTYWYDQLRLAGFTVLQAV